MLSFWESFIIHAAIAAVQTAIRNPVHAAAAKSVLVQLRDAINEAYPDTVTK